MQICKISTIVIMTNVVKNIPTIGDKKMPDLRRTLKSTPSKPNTIYTR